MCPSARGMDCHFASEVTRPVAAHKTFAQIKVLAAKIRQQVANTFLFAVMLATKPGGLWPNPEIFHEIHASNQYTSSCGAQFENHFLSKKYKEPSQPGECSSYVGCSTYIPFPVWR
jgi:hypothetical protein